VVSRPRADKRISTRADLDYDGGIGMRAPAVFALLLGAWTLSASAPPPADLAIRDVRVVHGDGRVTPAATILVRSGRITAVHASAGRGHHPARRSMDGRGLTALPGLIDAHVHVTDWALPLFLRWGVTTVRDLHNDPGYVLPLARDESPHRPRIVAAGALIDAPDSSCRHAIEVATPREARIAVRRQIADGAGVITAYTRLSPAMLQVIVQEARARGVPVAAHVGRTTAAEAARVGVTSLEHASGISDAASSDRPARLPAGHDEFLDRWTLFPREWREAAPARLRQVGLALRDGGVTLVPALARDEAFSRLADPDLLTDPALREVPRAIVEQEWDPRDIMRRAGWTREILAEFKEALVHVQRFVGAFADEGGRLAAGTDTAQPFVVPGASLHRELQLYVQAGLTPAAALRSATADAAELLGIAHRTGTLDAGKDADLLLVEGDPLADIRDTARIRAVVRAGVVVDRGR
jgi:imidazolonepropionase-like amidohydrolase